MEKVSTQNQPSPGVSKETITDKYSTCREDIAEVAIANIQPCPIIPDFKEPTASIDVTGYPPNECPCPNCQGRNFPEIQALEPRIDKVDLLRRHNWWALNNAITDACAASVNMMLFEQFLKTRCKKVTEADELYRILSLIDYLKDGDIDTLRFLLAPNPKRRKPALRSRKATKPELSALEVDQ